ncbi:MAG TPA: efflux RND transporter periplasmic adaptor subunit, partial [Thermoanaerobaculia bacterium]|nr:efflux RND transporter periplasmic adaptor subunit [Thermoanaerobaculia bacterium]
MTLLTAFLLYCKQNESRADAPPPIEIKATVHPSQAMTITAQIDGQVRSIAVREGSKIAANTPIVELTNPTVERDAAIARAQLDWVEARLRRGGRRAASTPARPKDSLEIAKKVLELKRQRLEKMRQLRKTNDITARELELAELEYLAALRDYNQERRIAAGAPATPDDTELLRIEKQKSTAEQRFAAQRQSLLHITSPISGTVTRLYVAAGQAVFPRDPIAEVSDVATLHVQGNVAPELLRYVKPGMRVEVKVFSVPPRNFVDEIEYVIPVQGAASESRAAAVVV